MNFIKERILNRREGQIFFWGSIIYLLLFISSQIVFTHKTSFSFILWMGGYMPLVLAIFYFKIGGFKKNYKSNNFDSALMGVISIVPIIVTIFAKLR